MKGAAIVRWTGRGNLENLESSVLRLLRDERVKARVRRTGGSLIVSGGEPAAVANMLGHMPGVSWIAVGSHARSYKELGVVAKLMAGKYLRKGDRFAVLAEATGSAVTSDVAGVVTSSALGEVEGARIDEEAPRTRFRAAFDGTRGAVGVEIFQGPGGTPTGSEEAVCLVSGGKHSSVLAWMTLLSGYRVSLVHWKVDDESLRDVARLYSELSNRVDYSKLSLEVLEGGSAETGSAGMLRGRAPSVFAGFHAGCSEIPNRLARLVKAPLFLLPEEEIDTVSEGLGHRGTVGKKNWRANVSGRASRWKFGGLRADVNGVLEGLTRQPLQSS